MSRHMWQSHGVSGLGNKNTSFADLEVVGLLDPLGSNVEVVADSRIPKCDVLTVASNLLPFDSGLSRVPKD